MVRYKKHEITKEDKIFREIDGYPRGQAVIPTKEGLIKVMENFVYSSRREVLEGSRFPGQLLKAARRLEPVITKMKTGNFEDYDEYSRQFGGPSLGIRTDKEMEEYLKTDPLCRALNNFHGYLHKTAESPFELYALRLAAEEVFPEVLLDPDFISNGLFTESNCPVRNPDAQIMATIASEGGGRGNGCSKRVYSFFMGLANKIENGEMNLEKAWQEIGNYQFPEVASTSTDYLRLFVNMRGCAAAQESLGVDNLEKVFSKIEARRDVLEFDEGDFSVYHLLKDKQDINRGLTADALTEGITHLDYDAENGVYRIGFVQPIERGGRIDPNSLNFHQKPGLQDLDRIWKALGFVSEMDGSDLVVKDPLFRGIEPAPGNFFVRYGPKSLQVSANAIDDYLQLVVDFSQELELFKHSSAFGINPLEYDALPRMRGKK